MTRRCDICGEGARGRKAGSEAAEVAGQLTLGAVAERVASGYICPACDVALRFREGVEIGGWVSIQCRVCGIPPMVRNGRSVRGSGRPGYKGRFAGRLRLRATTGKPVEVGELVDVVRKNEGAHVVRVMRVTRITTARMAVLGLPGGDQLADPIMMVPLASCRRRRRWFVEGLDDTRIAVNPGDDPRGWRFNGVLPIDPTVPMRKNRVGAALADPDVLAAEGLAPIEARAGVSR